MTAMTWIVAVLWVTNFFLGVFKINGYQSDESINAIFASVVGTSFLLKERNKGDRK